MPLIVGIAVASFLLLFWSAEKNILNDTVLLILAASITLTAMLFSAQHTRQQIKDLWQSYRIKKKKSNNEYTEFDSR
jgi:uncharacterized membrane protein affecting hemolysin expression